jgi:monovalent cation:H+ antiporter, CPA1 family
MMLLGRFASPKPVKLKRWRTPPEPDGYRRPFAPPRAGRFRENQGDRPGRRNDDPGVAGAATAFVRFQRLKLLRFRAPRMTLSIPTLGLILLVASVVAMISRRAGFPYSVGLVAAGLAIAFLPTAPQSPLSRELVFNVFLPPLVFEAALQLDWRRFRRELPLTSILAFAGVAVAAAIVAAGMHLLVGWSWIGAGLFSVLIAATDPVSVIAAFKELKVERRLSMVVEAESLLNDGAAAVGFGVLVGVAAGAEAAPAGLALAVLWTVAGAIVAGGAVAGGLLLLAGRTEDPLVEVTLTTIAAYGSFLAAEHLHASGVLASLTAGLVVGNVGWRAAISEAGRGPVLAFWEYAAFLANSIVFILIGIHEAHQLVGFFSKATLIAILLVLAGRLIAVYALAAPFAGSRLRLPASYQHVLFWGGLRGALALALALAVPASVPEQKAIVVTAFAVVAFSIFVQGLTMPALLRRLGLTRDPAAEEKGEDGR